MLKEISYKNSYSILNSKNYTHRKSVASLLKMLKFSITHTILNMSFKTSTITYVLNPRYYQIFYTLN